MMDRHITFWKVSVSVSLLSSLPLFMDITTFVFFALSSLTVSIVFSFLLTKTRLYLFFKASSQVGSGEKSDNVAHDSPSS